MEKRINKPTYKDKLGAVRHGYIQYGATKNGKRKFRIYEVKGGYNVSRKTTR